MRPSRNALCQISAILIATLASLSLSKPAKDDGQCESIGDLDLYVLMPTSAHVNKSRLNEVKNLTLEVLGPDDVDGQFGVKVTTIVYKKQPKIKFTSGDINDYGDLRGQILDVAVRVRSNRMRDKPPTFATAGLVFFEDFYKRILAQREEREPDKARPPVMLLFYVLETLNRMDLTTMANKLVDITSNTDVFSFIFIANPEGATASAKPTTSLPHISWNALAVDDSSDVLKYTDTLRRTMCRAARGNLCLMYKEAKKVDDKMIIQRSAVERKMTHVRESGATHVQTTPNTCCGQKIFSKPYDGRIQQCCPNQKISLIDEECPQSRR